MKQLFNIPILIDAGQPTICEFILIIINCTNYFDFNT